MNPEEIVRTSDEVAIRAQRSALRQGFTMALPVLRHGWRSGYAWVTLSIIAFAISIGLVLQAWNNFILYEKQLSTTGRLIIDTPQEPGRFDPFLGIIATVLARINSEDIKLPKGLTAKRYLAKMALKLSHQMQATFHDSESLTFDVDGVSFNWDTSKCPETVGVKTFGLGFGLCIKRSYSSVFVPPTERFECQGAATKSDDGLVIRMPNTGPKYCLQNRTEQAVKRGLFFSLLSTGALNGPEFQLPDDISQAYLISVDGVLAHTAHQPTSLAIPSSSPLIRWEARPYFQAFLGREPKRYHETRVYLDMTGLGLVKTYCELVHNRTSNEQVGVLCVDIQVDADRLIPDGFSRGAIMWSDGLLDYRLLSAHVRGGRLVIADTELAPKADSKVIDEISGLDADRMSTAVRVRDGFLLNVGRHTDWIRLLFVSPARRRRLSELLLLLAGLAFLVSMAGLIVSARHAAQASERAVRGAILRNLQMGVLELDEDEIIVAANDRAEELLGRPLQRFGTLEPAYSSRSFKDLIDVDFIVELKANGLDVSEPTTFSSVAATRRRGLTSKYFLRSSKTGRWMLATGSPITEIATTLSGRHYTTTATFGIFDEVPAGLARYLSELKSAYCEDPNSKESKDAWDAFRRHARFWLKTEIPQ